MSRALARHLFPHLADAHAPEWIADLLATTHIVGMHCPGLDSIYSAFHLRNIADAGRVTEASMSYEVQRMDERFRLVQLRVTGGEFEGRLDAFFRPRPVQQPSLADICRIVPADAFHSQRTLVVGGSRGLGELVAKIIAAGGGEVTITYARGRADAERVCNEAVRLGRQCSVRHLDVDAIDDQCPSEWITASPFTHVYYFASPPISRSHAPRWNAALFERFSRTYVHSFAALVGRLTADRVTGADPVRILYPSSVFVSDPEPGFVEYGVAKAAGEALCDQLQAQGRAIFFKPRLPRLRTDQNNALLDSRAADPLPVMLDLVKSLGVMTQPVGISAIVAEDLPDVAGFLHQHLNPRISVAQWIDAMRHDWSSNRPNFGAQMRAADTLVGVMLAIYSDQSIDGRTESFCNPHSWCVLPEYRNHGIGVVLQLIKQPGYHFTMLTPNPKVAQIFRGLRFRDLDDRLCYFPNLPTHIARRAYMRATSDPVTISAMLPEHARRDFELHRAIPWLHFIAFGTRDDVCLVVYKKTTVKRLPCAQIIHVSDPQVFRKYRGVLQSQLLSKEGLAISRVEARFVGGPLRFALVRKRMQAKLYASRTLDDSRIRDLYSELVALDV